METEKKSNSRPYRAGTRTPYTNKLFIYTSRANDLWVRRRARKLEWSLSRFVDELLTKVRNEEKENEEKPTLP